MKSAIYDTKFENLCKDLYNNYKETNKLKERLEEIETERNKLLEQIKEIETERNKLLEAEQTRKLQIYAIGDKEKYARLIKELADHNKKWMEEKDEEKKKELKKELNAWWDEQKKIYEEEKKKNEEDNKIRRENIHMCVERQYAKWTNLLKGQENKITELKKLLVEKQKRIEELERKENDTEKKLMEDDAEAVRREEIQMALDEMEQMARERSS